MVDEEYVEALGRLVFVFSGLEWNAVWCCERMETGYIYNLKVKTAGHIAADLVRYSGMQDFAVAWSFAGPASEFARLVKIRNAILHGKPGEAPDGQQRLFKDGTPWTAAMVRDACDAFAACSIDLNRLRYDVLKPS